MSRKDKLIEKLKNIDSELKWDELVVLLGLLGYKCINNSGSRRLFVNSDKKKITLHEPHPGNKVKKPYKKEVIKTLIERGELEK